MTIRDTGPSNIIIQDHEVDLDDWLKQHDATILVSRRTTDFVVGLRGPIHVETPGPCAASGTTPLEAVQNFANWITGARFSRTGPLGYVPMFTKESIVRAVEFAKHTGQPEAVPE